MWCLYVHSFQSYTLIFIQCAFQNFIVKRLFQYKTKHVSVILQEIKYSTRTGVRRKLSSGFFFRKARWSHLWLYILPKLWLEFYHKVS